MSLRSINQNLLPILLALLRERNVTRAARSVGLSQPAVSKALLQLRAILGDELLVRAGRGLVLTRKGEELLPSVAAICGDLESLWRAHSFDPARSSREFVIAGADYCAMLMVPALARCLTAQAPGISMRFVDLLPQLPIEERIDIDYAMIPDFMAPQSLIDAGCIMPLFADELVAVVANSHPLAAAHPSQRAQMAKPASITLVSNDPLLPKEMRATLPVTVAGSPTLAVVGQFLALPLLALVTDGMAVVPRRMMEVIAPYVPLRILDDLVPVRRVDMVLVWPKRRHDDEDHRWFRGLVATHLRDDRFS